MSIRTLILAAAFVVLAGAAGGGLDPAHAADARLEGGPPGMRSVAVESGHRVISLGVGKSRVVDLPSEVKDVLVTDPSIANAVIRSSRRAYLIGAKVGQTNILFFDAEGRQIAGYDIAVERDLEGLRDALKQALPNADIKVKGLGERSVVLYGMVATPAESQLAHDIARRSLFAPATSVGSYSSTGGGSVSSWTSVSGSSSSSSDDPVVNTLTIGGRDQVMLKVTVAEVQRDIIKQLGIDLTGTFGSGNTVVNFNTANPFSAFGQAISNSSVVGKFSSVTASLQAMERAGVIRTLAEPTLTAISGESAAFLAGGEFPIPGGLTCDTTGRNCQVSVQFKKFGISLSFTPVVLSEGRISLKVMTEASDLSIESSMAIQPTIGGPTITIPSIRTRRADTTVEIPSGGALALAGMIQEQTKQSINGFPGLLQLPVLGTLFRSRDYVNRQTELMILVTPYVVHAVAPKDLSRPDDGFADAADPASVLLGRLNRIYGIAGKAEPSRTYFGKYGFIID